MKLGGLYVCSLVWHETLW